LTNAIILNNHLFD